MRGDAERPTGGGLRLNNHRANGVESSVVNMTKLLCAAGLVLSLSAGSHSPMRPFDCEAYLEEAGETYWEKERVADYRMLFEERGTRRGWLEGSFDLLHIDFLRNRLIRVAAYRSRWRAA